MKDEEILKQAIKKVKKNGFDVELGGSGKVVKVFRGKDFTKEMPTVVEFIFSHSFAKAFWGEERVERCKQCKIDNDPRKFAGCYKCKYEKGYKKHLQQMVLEKNPLKYIEKYL